MGSKKGASTILVTTDPTQWLKVYGALDVAADLATDAAWKADKDGSSWRKSYYSNVRT